MTSITQNNAEQFNPGIESSFNQMRALDDILKNVPKNAHPIIKTFWNTNLELKGRIEKLNNQVVELSKDNVKIQEVKSYEYAERKRTEDLNAVLRRQLQDFYSLFGIVSLVFVLSDIFVDIGRIWIGESCRGAGIIAIVICAILSWHASCGNKEQINAISQEGKPCD